MSELQAIERLDIDRLTSEITESAKRADGVRYPSDRETKLTIELIQRNWEAFHGKPPQEGELVVVGEEHHRIAQVWDRADDGSTELQPAKSGSVYLHEGCGSFSGSLDSIATMRLTHVGWKLATFWIFYGGFSGAHRGVYFTIPTRVFAAI